MKITNELLDKLISEHHQLIQPREIDLEIMQLAKIGLELKNFDKYIKAFESAQEYDYCKEEGEFEGNSSHEIVRMLMQKLKELLK